MTQGRVPPRFMNEELCDRTMAFSLYQADEMPLMKGGGTKVEAIAGGVYRVREDVTNPRVTPTRSTRTIEHLVRGTGTMTVTYDSAKGGKATVKVAVK